MESTIKQLLQLPNTWQARHQPRQDKAYPSGFAALDSNLHLGGWPAAATTELLLSKTGHGELRLLLPTLRQRQHQAPWFAMIAPPFTPYAPALEAQGIEVERLLLIFPKTFKDLIWSSVQCLQSRHCSSVLTWCNRAALDHKELRRLQQAATSGQSWFVLMRPQHAQHQPSPSALRMALNPCINHSGRNGSEKSLDIKIIKQRGGWSGQELRLNIATGLAVDRISERPVYLSKLPEHPADHKNLSSHGSSRVLSLRNKQRVSAGRE